MPKAILNKKKSEKITIPLWVFTSIVFLLVAIVGFIFNKPKIIVNCIFYTCFFKYFAGRLDSKITINRKKNTPKNE